MDEDVRNLALAFAGIVAIIGLYLMFSYWGSLSSDQFWQGVNSFFNIKTYNK